tara:strand:+ start:222 stop:1358 length:1137 start_codon:yes stop_codon:yes gene_type:complete
MAYLKKNKNRVGKIYYSSRVNNSHWSKGYIYIPLKTSNYELALERHQEVESFEDALKRGMTFEWSWDKNTKGRTKIKKLTLNELVNKFVKTHQTNVRPSTIKRYLCGYNSLMSVIGKTCPPQTITNASIETWKQVVVEQGRKNNGINIDLRAIKTLLLWARDEGYIKKMPKIKMMPTQSNIKYIKDSDFTKIMGLDIDDFYKDCFLILRDIGVRRSDLVCGEIEDNFLVVSGEVEKTGIDKEIHLSVDQITKVQKIHDLRDKHLTNGHSLESFLSKITRAFQRACNKIGIYEQGKTTLHCLRHTYAVRTYLECRDIFKVCQLLHHTSVTTTEKYARLNLNRLEQDFPSLHKVSKVSKLRVLDTQKRATLTYDSTSYRQ